MPTQNSAAEFSLSMDEVRSLVDAAGTFRNRVLIRTLYYTGIRRQELCDLEVPDIDFDRHRIYVRHGKGNKSRIVPIPKDLATDFRMLIGRRRSGPVFLSQRGHKLATRTVNYIVARAGKLAGISNPNPRRKTINPHILRHTFARQYLRNGGQMYRLSQILGHASVAVTHAVYGTASEEEIQEEYNKVLGGITV